MEQFAASEFRSICIGNGVQVSDSQLDALGRFLGLLLHMNKSVNLISRRDEKNLWHGHVLHSVSIGFQLDLTGLKRALDLGSGGGFPGVPLKIIFPWMDMTLVDSIGKKVEAVKEIIAGLGLHGIRVVRGRAEELPTSMDWDKSFDTVVARAVAPLKSLAQWSYPLLRAKQGPLSLDHNSRLYVPPGTLIAFKGGDIREELDETRRLGYVQEIRELPLRFRGLEKTLLSGKKIILVRFSHE